MPGVKKGKAHKFACPFHGPYRVVELSPNYAKVVPVDRPREQPTYVALERLRQCLNELPPGESWPQPRAHRLPRATETSQGAKQEESQANESSPEPTP